MKQAAGLYRDWQSRMNKSSSPSNNSVLETHADFYHPSNIYEILHNMTSNLPQSKRQPRGVIQYRWVFSTTLSNQIPSTNKKHTAYRPTHTHIQLYMCIDTIMVPRNAHNCITIILVQDIPLCLKYIKVLKTKRNLLYIRNQSVPRSKLFPPRL